MIAEYQELAVPAGADPLGYYVAPQAYAQMQVIEQAVTRTGSLDDEKLAQFTRDRAFKTILGDVKFGDGGGWSEPRVLEVQYQNIKGNDLAVFKDVRTQAVVWPSDLSSGALIYPYAKAKQNV
jgi:branched-chain amino acid transport system substrate-binding protein